MCHLSKIGCKSSYLTTTFLLPDPRSINTGRGWPSCTVSWKQFRAHVCLKPLWFLWFWFYFKFLISLFDTLKNQESNPGCQQTACVGACHAKSLQRDKQSELQRPNISKHAKSAEKVPLMVWSEIQDHHGPPHHHSNLVTSWGRNSTVSEHPSHSTLGSSKFWGVFVDLFDLYGLQKLLAEWYTDILDILAYLGIC